MGAPCTTSPRRGQRISLTVVIDICQRPSEPAPMHATPVEALLQPLPPDHRRATLDRYLDFLHARDGSLDISRRSLSRRDDFFRRIEEHPVRFAGPIDAEQFHRNHERARPEPGLSEQMLWLLACAKA